MQYSTNYNLNKPERLDQYNIDHWNENTDKIDEELKKREDDDISLLNPAYTVRLNDSNLVSGESIFTAFGKLAKIVSSFITHKATETSVHGSTSLATATKLMERDANARVKIADGVAIDDASTLKQIQNAGLSKKFIGAKVVSASNITLFGTQTIDDTVCNIGDIVLVLGQNTSTENGLYIVQSGDWTRHPDYDTADKINNTLICIVEGTYAGYVYKASTATYTAGTTTLIFINSDYPISEEAKVFWRNKIDAGKEYRPPIGVPTIWMGSKPDWALDFGNGATTKYMWANYPGLWKSAEFKNILQTLVNAGWMTQFDTAKTGGFYIPDLRGIVPIGYGTNAKRTSETTAGGSLAEYVASANKSHNHTITVTLKNSSHTGEFAGDDQWGSSTGTGCGYASGVFSKSSTKVHMNNDTKSSTTSYRCKFSLSTGVTVNSATSTAVGGNVAKPATIGVMWIIRFE